MSVQVRLSRVHHPVTSLGWGSRIGIWFQGCSLHCPGCISRDTWEHEAGFATTVTAVVDHVAQVATAEPVDGVTISGGEPFEQPEALAELAAGLAGWREGQAREVDLLSYSGLRQGELHQAHGRILAHLDAVVCERFELKAGEGDALRGSANQNVVLLTELGRQRYGQPRGPAGQLQVSVEDGRVWMIGIPRRGDLAGLERALRTTGVALKDVSWRP
jgi:anaerobic ribonucleoside-triphosphate reductase activating protein